MNARFLLALPAVFFLVGCSTHNHYQLRDTLARLPNGDEITCVEAVDKMPDRTYADTCLQWRRLAPTESLVQIQGQGEVRFKQAGKILTPQGETYIKVGRSVHYDNVHSQMSADEIERTKRWQEMFAHAQTHVSADGNRAWLQYQGRTFASFDYDQAIAIFGEQNQPAWAVSASER